MCSKSVTSGQEMAALGDSMLLLRNMKESLMRGIIKKFNPQGFGIIESADGSKLPFIRSDFARYQFPREGQTVIFSIRKVKDKVFASNVFARREALNAV